MATNRPEDLERQLRIWKVTIFIRSSNLVNDVQLLAVWQCSENEIEVQKSSRPAAAWFRKSGKATVVPAIAKLEKVQDETLQELQQLMGLDTRAKTIIEARRSMRQQILDRIESPEGVKLRHKTDRAQAKKTDAAHVLAAAKKLGPKLNMLAAAALRTHERVIELRPERVDQDAFVEVPKSALRIIKTSRSESEDASD